MLAACFHIMRFQQGDKDRQAERYRDEEKMIDGGDGKLPSRKHKRVDAHGKSFLSNI